MCEECGALGPLHVNHIKELRGDGWSNLDDNSIENLQTLCQHCHSVLHNGETKKDKKPSWGFPEVMAVEH